MNREKKHNKANCVWENVLKLIKIDLKNMTKVNSFGVTDSCRFFFPFFVHYWLITVHWWEKIQHDWVIFDIVLIRLHCSILVRPTQKGKTGSEREIEEKTEKWVRYDYKIFACSHLHLLFHSESIGEQRYTDANCESEWQMNDLSA